MKTLARTMLTKLLNSFGYDVVPKADRRPFPLDFTNDEIAVCRRVKPFTMTDDVQLACLIRAVEHVVRFNVPGQIVECGVWKGGSMMAAALTLRRLGDLRQLYLYDTYEGFPAGSEVDRNWKGESAAVRRQQEGPGWGLARLDEVQAAIQSTGYDQKRCHYVKGMVEQTIPKTAPDSIALLRLDTDFYASTLHELNHLYPLLSPGGVLIIDDYGGWEGARKATDEFLETLPHPVFLNRVNDSCRLVVK